MALGSAFPPQFLQAQIRRRLVPGAVIKLMVTMDDGELQEKRFVVIKVDDNTSTCVINSEIGPYIQARPHLARCQASMPVAQHDFMDHDSFVDCSRARQYKTPDVLRDLQNEPTWILGAISEDLRDQIVAGLKASTLIAPKDVSVLCACLDAIDYSQPPV